MTVEETTLTRANRLLREGRLDAALSLYETALQEMPELGHHIRFNMRLAEKWKGASSPTASIRNAEEIGERDGVQGESGAATAQPCSTPVQPTASLTKPEGMDDYTFERIEQSGLFDVNWYLEQHGHLLKPGENPLAHYLARGVKEGLNPSEMFNTSFYLRVNPDVAQADIHPLIHYIFYGKAEGRLPLDSYAYWIENVEKPGLPSLHEVRRDIEGMSHKPLISILLPVYNTPETYLRQCIESLLSQSYPHWQLCIADDNSSAHHIKPILAEYENRDERIRCVYRQTSGHISEASNSALEIATGEWITFLDHDDELSQHALYFVVKAINQHPQAKLIYSDEDKIDANGQRSDPHFKSDWNPDLLFSQNYICHLAVYRRSLIDQVGGLRKGVEGSQDHDLLLRCMPHLNASSVIHIPRILYHWRMIPGSTALATESKEYTSRASIRVLRDYFNAQGPEGVQVEVGLHHNTYRVRWPVPEVPPLVSLLIPTRDRKTITEVAVRSILEKTRYQNYEIIILDNGSVEPETLAWFAYIQQQDSRVRVVRYDHPFNFSAINNYGVRQARGEIIGLINNDVEVINSDWLTEMVSHAVRPDIGCVGAKLYYPNDTLQHGGVILGVGGVANHSHKHFPKNHPGYFARLLVTQNLSAVTAACLIVRREIYEAVGGLDEEHLTVAFNDVDFCLKVREAGYRNLWTPFAELYHHESVSRGYEDSPEKQARFKAEIEFMQSKWGEKLKVDPYYNPNLTLNREDFSMSARVLPKNP